MNLAIAAATFALVLPAELPDKTFLSAIVLSSRHRALPVFAGAFSALVFQAGLGVIAGRLLDLLPHRIVEGIVSGLFLAGAAYLIFVPEKHENEAASARVAEGEKALSTAAPPRPEPSLRIFATTFGIVALAEFGDLTQILIANLAARWRAPVSVFSGAVVAFGVTSGAGIALGRNLTRFVPLSIVRRASGLALIGLGLYSLVGLLT